MEFENYGIGGLFLSAFISSTIAPGGSEAVLIYMINQSSGQVNLLVIVATIGNTLGALTTWFLGNWAAKKITVEALLDEKYKKPLTIVKRWGVWSLFFSWLPVIGDGLCFVGGWLKLPLFISTLNIMIGKFIRYGVIAYLMIL